MSMIGHYDPAEMQFGAVHARQWGAWKRLSGPPTGNMVGWMTVACQGDPDWYCRHLSAYIEVGSVWVYMLGPLR